MIQYIPKKYVDMPKLAEQPFVSAWKGHDRILHDLIERFQISCHTALEFGVQWGYSTSALANVFEKVIGIDTFQGDKHSGVHGLCFSDTARRLQSWSNIQLCQQTYQDRIALDKEQYDLIHVDIVHTYEDTLALGLWATAHAKLVIFHDTES